MGGVHTHLTYGVPMTPRASRRLPAGVVLGLVLPVLAVTPGAASAAPSTVLGAAAPAAATAAAAADEVGYAQIDALPDTVLLPESQFAVTGVLGNKLARTVHLTHTASGTTRTVATTTSTADGRFTFARVSVPSTGSLVATTPEQTLQVPAGAAAVERHRLVQKKVKDLVRTVQTRRKAKDKAAKRLAKAKPGTSGKRMGQLLRAAGKTKIQLRVARKALARARAREVVTGAALVRRVVVRRAVSKPVSVTVAPTQTGSAQALPPIAQPGATPAAPATGAVVSARFSPARPGRSVRLEQLQSGQWRTVGTQPQDRSGHAVFQAAPNATYRAVAEATAEAAEVVTTEVPTRTWTLDFSDTFDGASLDAGKWEAQERPLDTGLRSCATTDGSSYGVGGGVLRLGVSRNPARKDTCAYTDDKGVEHALPYMRNTQIATLGRYQYRYGFAAARMKVQSSVGMHSAFWNQPTQQTVGGRPDQGVEVDVMEYFGDYPRDDGFASFQHVLQADNRTVKKIGRTFPETALMKGTERFSANYHVYSVEWTPSSYVFRVDGREYHRTNENISQVEQFLLLSMLTSSYELVNLENVDDVAQVDWVQVWQ